MRLVEIREFSYGKRRDTFRQITVNTTEQTDQVPSFHLGKAREGLVTDFIREVEDAGEDQARLIGQDEPAGSTVAGIGPPLDPTVLFHSIDLSNQGHRFDFEQIGKAGLVDALVAGEISQHLALCPGEAQEQQRTLVEAAPKEAGDVVNEKPKAAVEIHGRYRNAKQVPNGDNKPCYQRDQPSSESRLVDRNSMACRCAWATRRAPRKRREPRTASKSKV